MKTVLRCPSCGHENTFDWDQCVEFAGNMGNLDKVKCAKCDHFLRVGDREAPCSNVVRIFNMIVIGVFAVFILLLLTYIFWIL